MSHSTPRERFIEWFVKNYPPATIISDPVWHAPKVWNFVMRELNAEETLPSEAADDMIDEVDKAIDKEFGDG